MRRQDMYLEVKDLKKSYGEGGGYVQVLKGITAGVEQGEMCVIPVSYTHLDVYKRQDLHRFCTDGGLCDLLHEFPGT